MQLRLSRSYISFLPSVSAIMASYTFELIREDLPPLYENAPPPLQLGDHIWSEQRWKAMREKLDGAPFVHARLLLMT